MLNRDLRVKLKEYMYQWFVHSPEKWIHKGTICDAARSKGYMADTVGRELRDMVVKKELQGKLISINGRQQAHYRWIPVNKVDVEHEGRLYELYS